MRTKNVQTVLDTTDVWAIPAELVKREDQFLQQGDLLISSANSWNLVGKACWVPALHAAASFGGFVTVLRADNSIVDSRYLYYWFTSDRTQASLRSFGQKTTNISNLNIRRCEAMEVPLPPMEEQRRIAAILDQAEELRAQRRAAIALLDQLPQAIFLEMFGDRFQIFEKWPTMPLGSLLSFLTSGSRGWAKHYAASGAHFLRIQNVRSDELDLCDVAFVRPPSTKEAKRTRVEAGDVLLSITADLGRTAVVDDRISAGYINQHLAILRPAPELDSQFLSSFIASEAGQVQIQQKNRHGVKAGLNFDDIKTIATPLPPFEIQRDFATRVQASRQVKSVFQAALSELDALFDSLQSHVFGSHHA